MVDTLQTLQTQVNRPQAESIATPDTAAKEDADIRAAAQEFEAVFISQMLKFSGLDKALTSGGGQSASAFTSFYLDQIATDISEDGGFGLADEFYEQMKAKASPASQVEGIGDINVRR